MAEYLRLLPFMRPAKQLDEFRQNLRYGARMLARSLGFTLVALISLALGICIATCALSEMNGMVLRSLPGVANPAELVAIQVPTSPLRASLKAFRSQCL